MAKKVEKEQTLEEKGLKLQWILFIDEYLQNGFNATKAYRKVYKCSKKTAESASYRLLDNVGIKKEIDYRLSSQRVTDDFIIAGLASIATDYRGSKTINAAVKSYEILAKVKGMLVDTKKIAFTGENPAVFESVYSAKEKKEFDKIKEDKQRIVE